MEKSVNDITQRNAYKKYIYKVKDRIFTYNFKEEKCSLWQSTDFMKNYPLQEKFLDKLFSEYKNNTDEGAVFIKVRVLDSFYSTNLKEGLDDMVENIVSIENFDDMLKKGDIKLIDKIKKVKSTKYKTKDCISFASKYCSRYQKSKFAIYDKYVKQMLCLINKATNFAERKLTIDCMHKMSYKEYCKVVDKFIDKFNKDKLKNQKINYKTFDCYIWTWAKEILYKINKGKLYKDN